MPSLTQPHDTYEKPGIVLAYPLHSVPIFKGALVGLTEGGEIAPLSPDRPMRFLGVSGETVDPANRAVRVSVAKMGSFVFACVGSTLSVADFGRPVYASSDWEVQTSPVGLECPVVIGTIVAIETVTNGAAGVRVRIDLHTV